MNIVTYQLRAEPKYPFPFLRDLWHEFLDLPLAGALYAKIARRREVLCRQARHGQKPIFSN